MYASQMKYNPYDTKIEILQSKIIIGYFRIILYVKLKRFKLSTVIYIWEDGIGRGLVIVIYVLIWCQWHPEWMVIISRFAYVYSDS